MIRITAPPETLRRLLDTMAGSPHRFYDVVAYGPNGTLTVRLDEDITFATSLTDSQIATLKQNIDVAVAFTRVGEHVGIRIRTV